MASSEPHVSKTVNRLSASTVSANCVSLRIPCNTSLIIRLVIPTGCEPICTVSQLVCQFGRPAKKSIMTEESTMTILNDGPEDWTRSALLGKARWRLLPHVLPAASLRVPRQNRTSRRQDRAKPPCRKGLEFLTDP